MDAGDAEGALSHYMKDMPPEWLADAKASSEWGEIAAGVVSLRADGQSLAWAAAALEDGVLGGIRKPVLAMYGTETFPEMPRARRASSKPSPAPSRKPCQARSTPGSPSRWRPSSPPSSRPASNHPQRRRSHRSVATAPCPSRTVPVAYLGLCQWGLRPGGHWLLGELAHQPRDLHHAPVADELAAGNPEHLG